MPFTPLLREPFRTLLEDVADPPKRLDVLVQRRAAEDADLRDVRRAIARQAALAFDAFDHRALFTADVSAGAAAQLDEARGSDAGSLERRDLAPQDLEYARVLVTHIEVDALRLDAKSRDQRAFERAVRVALEEPAVLERAGLALVAVDRHQARAGVRPDELPFLAGREACAAKAAQTRRLQLVDDRFGGQLARAHPLVERVAALLAVLRERDVARNDDVGSPLAHVAQQAFDRGVLDFAIAHSGRGRAGAAADACGAHDSNLARIDAGAQFFDQVVGTRDHAADGFADADGDRGGPRLALLDDVEVVVERSDLVDLGLRQAHFLGERAQMTGLETAELVLDQVQVLDQ
jgi:hypothetical protein